MWREHGPRVVSTGLHLEPPQSRFRVQGLPRPSGVEQAPTGALWKLCGDRSMQPLLRGPHQDKPGHLPHSPGQDAQAAPQLERNPTRPHP